MWADVLHNWLHKLISDNMSCNNNTANNSIKTHPCFISLNNESTPNVIMGTSNLLGETNFARFWLLNENIRMNGIWKIANLPLL